MLRSSVALSSTATLRDLRTPVNKKFLQRNRRPNGDLPSKGIIRSGIDRIGIPSRKPSNFDGERKPTHAFVPQMGREDCDAIGRREFGRPGTTARADQRARGFRISCMNSERVFSSAWNSPSIALVIA